MGSTLPPVTQRNLSHVINELLSDVRHVDMVYMTLMIILLIIISIGMIIGIKRALGRYSYLYIDIIAETRSYQLRFATLPDASRNTVIRIPKTPLKLNLLNFYLFRVLSLTRSAPKAVNTLDGNANNCAIS
jgi:hypothetical protein